MGKVDTLAGPWRLVEAMTTTGRQQPACYPGDYPAIVVSADRPKWA